MACLSSARQRDLSTACANGANPCPLHCLIHHAGSLAPRAEAAALAGAAAAASWEACLDATEAQQWPHSNSCSPSKQQLLLYQHAAGLDSCQQQQPQHRPVAAGAVGSRSPPSANGWDALRQQSHVLLADNEQLQRDNRVLQKQKEQLQAKVSGVAACCLPLSSSTTCHRAACENVCKLEAVVNEIKRD